MSAAAVAGASENNVFFSFLPEWADTLLLLLAIIGVPVLFVMALSAFGGKVLRALWFYITLKPWRRKKLREQLAAGMQYYRDSPAGGDLKIAQAVMNSLSSSWQTDYSGLFGGLFLRLVDKEALVMDYKSPMYGAEPHLVLSINTKVNAADRLKGLELEFFELLEGAAGIDKVLQPRELQQYIRNNDVLLFKNITNLTDEEKAVAQNTETAQQLLGLRKFLLDFSLIEEREIREMTLWKEYLVYATLFGIADKVCENFAEVYPDYFKMNEMAQKQLKVVRNQAFTGYVDAMMQKSKAKTPSEQHPSTHDYDEVAEELSDADAGERNEDIGPHEAE